MLFTHESPHSSFDIFFFNDTATTEIYTLSLHDALPIFIAANHTFNAAPKDGTIIGNISGPIVLEQLFGSPSVQFDLAKFRYLAVPVSESYLMIVHKRTGITKFDEIRGEKGKQVTFGAIPGSTVEHAP